MLHFLALSFHQPKFCPTASWNHNGITFANQPSFGIFPDSLFINTNNTIYAASSLISTIFIWAQDSVNPINTISEDFRFPQSLFVTSNGDIYIGSAYVNPTVRKWIAENETFVTVMNVNSSCDGLFVDTNDTLYCSMRRTHQVVKKSLNDPEMRASIVAAGNGSQGSAFNELNRPRGIFVDVNFDLYVADHGNNRIQLFQSGESTGITVAGVGSANPTIHLIGPIAIILDAEKYLFILEEENHRIVGSSSNGFRCLIGCYGTGSKSNQLSMPRSFSFDRCGNIFVADWENRRIQKFEYFEKSCGMSKKMLIKFLRYKKKIFI